MTRHIVAWNFKEDFTPEQKQESAQKMKQLLEELPGLIDGIVELRVHTTMPASSNREVVLNSLFESDEALAAYITHPEHKRVGQYVRAVTQDRAGADFQE